MASMRENSTLYGVAPQPSEGNVNLLYSRPLEEYITTLRKGSWLLKHGRYGKPKLHYFRLVNHDTQLSWRSANGSRRTVDLRKIKEVRRGQTTEVFKRNPQTSVANISFSLLYPGEENEPRSLDLICPGDDNFDMWFHGIKAVAEQIRGVPSTALVVGKPVARVPTALPSYRSELKMKSMSLQEQPTPGRVSGDIGVPVASRCPGDLYVWGSAEASASSGKKDASSTGYAIRSSSPRLVLETKKLDVVKVAVGVRHCALITYGGDLYSWGVGKGGQLGHGNQDDIGAPTRVNTLWGTKVHSVNCSSGVTAAVTIDNELFTWGDGTAGTLGYDAIRQYIPRQVLGFGIGISEVSLGPYHAAAVGTDGSLFTWGDGMAGKLGHGNNENYATPCRVMAFDSHRVICVACGYWHTAAIAQESRKVPDGVDIGHITLDTSANSLSGSLRKARPGNMSEKEAGVLYTWGGELSWQECRTDAKGNIECKRDNHKGCLGLGTLDGFWTPQRVSGALASKGVVQVVAGLTFTAVVTQDLKVYQMGELSSSKDCSWSSCRVPEQVRGGLENYRVEDLTCGMQHIAAVALPVEKRSLGGAEVPETGIVFTWGRGQEGQLGIGTRNPKASPAKVDALSGKKVLQVACGEYYTMAVCEHNTRSEDSEEREQLQEAKDFFKYRIKGTESTSASFAYAATPSFTRNVTSAALTMDSDSAELESYSSSSDILSRHSSHLKLHASATNPFGMLKAINEWKRSKSMRKSHHYSNIKSMANGVRIVRKPSFRGLPSLPPQPDMANFTNRADPSLSWGNIGEQLRENSASEYSADVVSNTDERNVDKDHEDDGSRKDSDIVRQSPDRSAYIRELEAKLHKAELLLARRTSQNDVMQRRNDEMKRELNTILGSGGRSVPHSPANSVGSMSGPLSIPEEYDAGATPSASPHYSMLQDAREERIRDRERSLYQQEHLLLRRCREVEAKEAELSRKEDDLNQRLRILEDKEQSLDKQWLMMMRDREGKPTVDLKEDKVAETLSGAVLSLLSRPVEAQTNGSVARKASEIWLSRYDSLNVQSASQQQLITQPQQRTASRALSSLPTIPQEGGSKAGTPFLTPSHSLARSPSPDPPSSLLQAQDEPLDSQWKMGEEVGVNRKPGEVWTEELDKGVFFCFEMKDKTPQLVRIRFSRRKFSKEGAEQWYLNNRMRIAERYTKLAGSEFGMNDSDLKLATSMSLRLPADQSSMPNSSSTPQHGDGTGDWLDYSDSQRPRSISSPASLEAPHSAATMTTTTAAVAEPHPPFVQLAGQHRDSLAAQITGSTEPQPVSQWKAQVSGGPLSGDMQTLSEMLQALPGDSPDSPPPPSRATRRSVTWADR